MKNRALAVGVVLLLSLTACAADSESQPVTSQSSQRESPAPAAKAATTAATPITGDQKPEDAPQPERATAASNCFSTGKLSACLAETDDIAVKQCLGQCIKAIDARDRGAAKQAEADCEAKVVASLGKRTLACGIASVATTEDETKLKTEFATALKARNADQLDAVMARVVAQDKRNDEVFCAKTCNERGRNLVRAPIEGPALVTSYKQCMVKADSTAEARKLAAYEETLYCAYITKADTRCRDASKCDWVEKFSDLVCTYDTPGRGLAECGQ